MPALVRICIDTKTGLYAPVFVTNGFFLEKAHQL